ncbi:uncharacterized protein F4822DRAFT_418926 [Hypoxylon trugodes]|uniref:uncharacterized protein n=1 Tax=Hypoxylon trugodes TaxID=326681 RepID=UPI0021956F19|nr:uncharacterized protein F4822DRAFT_418926 [Hypoxylon trugodes]KAI1384179.1 hypothetical protein F4822DRAFT_418926 [Hypoxylon trugodes]
MSTADVFLSSPAGPARFHSYTMSSSPNIPPLNELFPISPKRPPLRSGNHAAPIPNNVHTTFKSAACLLRDAPEIDIETEQLTNSPPRKPNSDIGRKRKTPTPEITSIPAETPILIESSPGEKPWQKFKSKESTSKSEQPPIPKVRAAKAASKGKAKGKTGTVSKHFATKQDAAKPADGILDNGTTGDRFNEQAASSFASSELASKRRDSWTPPPANIPFAEPQSDNRELPLSIEKETKSQDVFHTLHGQYGYKDVPSFPPLDPPQLDVLKKHKLIELVSTSNDLKQRSRETSPSKVVNTKKKARTITELATAPYMPSIGPDLDLAGPTSKESLLGYFDSDGTVKALVEHQTVLMTQKKEKAGESKAPKKPKRKKKSGTADNPILLSPNSALKQSSNQDFVFGTSSQLVREESPTTLRDLQLAIQASNQVDSDPFAESDSQGLWHAGARDTDGELMKMDDVEVVENVPSLSRRAERRECSSTEFVDINDILKSSEVDELSTGVPQQNSHFLQSQSDPNAPLPETDGQGPSESNQCAEGGGGLRPDFELLNDSQLAARIASYGFKPVKKRQAMISLLDQCWMSQNSGAPMIQSRSISTSSSMTAPKRKQSSAAATSTTTQPENAPKRRGRPRKNSVATEPPTTAKTTALKEASSKKPRARQRKNTARLVEIADSDLDEAISSSPSSRASSPDMDRIFSSPPPVDLSLLSEDADMTTGTGTDQQQEQEALFRHITRAVKAAPRSRDPANPSWHEKMLLYDPIVLEDLAAWLNAGALSGVGYDGEINPYQVKLWCESKSVICLWRQNLSGKDRKVY